MGSSKSTVQLIKSEELLSYTKVEFVSLKGHPYFNEAWLHEVIKADPRIIGLGDLILRDHERRQKRAGRLDLLMDSANTNERFEIEIQLGSTDESHIIRTLEYWDNEKKRYPQYEHRAVIIAEDITTRFLNVVSLFNGHIPFIAIQVKAIKVQNQIGLIFTKILNEVDFSQNEEEQIIEPEVNRNFWEAQSDPETVEIADTLLEYTKQFAQGFRLKYNRPYIGLMQNNRAQNFAIFIPKKGGNFHLKLTCKISDDLKKELEAGGLNVGEYSETRKGVFVYLNKDEIGPKRGIIIKALKYAFDCHFS